ncbi:MAG: HlyD family efflux transporter periplasmic adaptor subunit [Thermoleophilia bacterium]
MKKRRRWWLLGALVIVAAAVSGGLYWYFGGDEATPVTYLTDTVSKGTLSQTIEADFTLASGQTATSISVAGTSSSSSSTTADTDSTTADAADAQEVAFAATASGSGAVASVDPIFAAYASCSPTPSPTPTITPTDTPSPTPTPTPTSSGRPTPTPTPTPTSGELPSGSGGSSSGGSSSGGSGTVGSASATTTTTTSTVSSTSVSGIVTRLLAAEGAAPQTLQRLLKVSGKYIFAFVSPAPLWKDLSTDLATNEQRANVIALQRALKAGGYYTKAINGRFTSATETAYKAWQADNGLSKTGVVDVSRFVWLPKGSVISSWNVALGSQVSGGTALASISVPQALIATAQVSQADIGQLEVGQKAEMTIDGYTDDAFNGVITFIASDATSASGGSSSGSTQFAITVRPRNMPDVARSGMTGTLTIVIAERTDVLLVPTSAITGDTSTSYVRVMVNGEPVTRQIETGLATSEYTEVTSGLTEGETIVTGEFTSGATSTSTGTSTETNRNSMPGGVPGSGFQNGGGQMGPQGGGQ